MKDKNIPSSSKIQTQFSVAYLLALVIPILIIGLLLLIGETSMLRQYNQELLNSDNQRVHAILFEITNQAYTYSEDICFDDSIRELLKKSYKSDEDFRNATYSSSVLSSIIERTSQIEDVKIYTDNPTVCDFSFYAPVTDEIAASGWYNRAINQSSSFWTIITKEDSYGNTYSYLSLIRRVPLINSDINAVLVIEISDNYLRSLISTTDYNTILSLDEGTVFFSDDRDLYGNATPYSIDYSDRYFKAVGLYKIGEERYLSSISSFTLYQSDSIVHLCVYSLEAYNNIQNITLFYIAIIVLAIFLPGTLMFVYIRHFSSRVEILRERIHKASQEDYTHSLAIKGNDELADVYQDLDILIHNIQTKESQMYQVELDAKELKNEQQQMEYKMLASQINPHFLYNTLETIRMKAITAGNKEVANAIKLLGKSMRYVLENTTTSSTSLQKELDYVITYLTIQKLRFEDRVNYSINVEESIDPERIAILPLLLQPIVENAILHGLEKVTENGQIMINVYTAGTDNITISVKDNGSGLSSEELKSIREKLVTPSLRLQSNIGLYNIHERIRLYYGSAYGVTIESEKNVGTEVKISIPKINL